MKPIIKYLGIFVPALFCTINSGVAKIEVKNADCEYDARLGYELCKTTDESPTVQQAAHYAQGSYKLEERMFVKSSPAAGFANWGMVDLSRPNVEKFLQKNLASKIVHFGTRDAASGVIAMQGNRIIVAFHGTQDAADISTDAQAFLKDINVLGMPVACKAHSGFIDRYLHDRPDMQHKLYNMIDVSNMKNQPLEILVTGHSLGGALATLAAYDIQKNLLPTATLKLVTFNSPRVFNTTAAQEFETLLGKNSLRLWRHYDPVSAVPMGRLGYKHVGKSLKLPYISYFNPGENHKMKYTIDEIASVYTIRPDEAHKGWF
ncbi:lipase family protein [Caedibacter taeniospiralis]|jgi:hypothetical protein|uniref:lipase family protein n=1 Tax=Caedibacter taeniospiralis TaxID=28907 RepID=UPI0037BF8BA1